MKLRDAEDEIVNLKRDLSDARALIESLKQKIENLE